MRVYLSYPDLSYFLFPEARRIKNFGYVVMEEKVLYQLKPGEKINEIDKSLSLCFREHIILTNSKSHSVDVSLESRQDFLSYISSYRGIRAAKDLEKRVESLSEQDFLHFIKMSMSLKRWYREIFNSREKMYHLFESMSRSKKEFLSLYVDLLKQSHPSEMFASMLTFYNRIINWEEQKDTLGDYYKNVVRIARNQALEIKQNLIKVLSLPKEIPSENKCLGFYLMIKG